MKSGDTYRYRNANAGHDVTVRALYPMMGRMWMCELLHSTRRWRLGERLLISDEHLKPEETP